VINLQNVSMCYPKPKRYKDYLLYPFRKSNSIRALFNVTLKIAKGESIGFLGPNGAGKTTLLKLIGGLLYPTSGKVIIDNYDTSKDNHRTRSKVGYILNEERSFYWRLTGIQNLEFFGALDNLYGTALRRRIEELIKLVGLENVADKRVSNYSSGMRQRLAVARGLLADPDILILDEPTRALDPLGAENLRNLILDEIHLEGHKTLVIATHQVEEAEMMCNTICIVANGCVLASDSMDKITHMHGGLSRYYKEVNKSELAQC